MSDLITSSWLRANGFLWHQMDRQPSRHWTLKIGDCLPQEEPTRMMSTDDFMVEVARGLPGKDDWWFVWFRADYAGRYSRFLCAGHLTCVDQLTGMIGGIVGRPFRIADVWGGMLIPPERAARYRDESEHLHQRMAKDWKSRECSEKADQVHRAFGDRPWFHHVEIEDGCSVVLYVKQWPDRSELRDLPGGVGIEVAGGAE